MRIHINIVLLNTSAGKLIFKPYGINKLLLPVFGFLLDGLRGLCIGLFFGIVLDMRFIAKERPAGSNKTKSNADILLYKLMLG
ncbi:MAG: hypothetical protein ACK4IY_09975, partial [Chitinophagales bacterium]